MTVERRGKQQLILASVTRLHPKGCAKNVGSAIATVEPVMRMYKGQYTNTNECM
jgi:hypothetical protein